MRSSRLNYRQPRMTLGLQLLLVTGCALLLAGCGHNPPLPPVSPPRIPPLSPLATLPTPPAQCLPSCSAGAASDAKSWLDTLTGSGSQPKPVSATTGLRSD